MRTRSASKRPIQEHPEKIEEAVEAISPKPRDKRKGKLKVGLPHGISVKACDSVDSAKESAVKEEGEGKHEEAFQTEMDWEDGDIPTMEGFSHDLGKEVTIEFTDLPSSAEKRTSRRLSPEEKELAELVHKVHLLCLLARGRMIDKTCNDPLIQASMLSLLPSNLLKITEAPNLTVNNLKPLVNWFHSNFHLLTESVDRGSFESNIRFALQNQKGTVEEVAALSVVLFRALNLAARFVSILDVTSLKPDGSNRELHRLDTKAVPSTIVNASNRNLDNASPLDTKTDTCSTPQRNKRRKKETAPTREKFDECTEGPKRKGDVEFEMQLEMALSATLTATKTTDQDHSSPAESSGNSKKLRGKSAIWSRSGPPLYWAEVYCSGETLNGRWVHVDAVNEIVDGEEKVEAAAAVCRRPLRYAIAFAGNGAKDVTRRYCLQWYKVAPNRVNMQWWDRVMAPLKELESIATGQSSVDIDNATINPTIGDKQLGSGNHSHLNQSSYSSNRTSLEDMELETRALTEPLPTNQLAYKNHHLYAIEKWLTKNQKLHPRGPVLGYCSGHPVYPRSCVQTLQTRQKWMREGLQVRANQLPAKIVKHSKKVVSETSICDEEEQSEANLELYGKWQLEPLQLPHAINGIVPKNEHGNVEVWSEKCIPPGTVHLRLPRLVPVVKRLEINFAPALVGFEFRNSRTYPVFEGIVVCSEFKDAILEAYAEEEERREAAEKKRHEAQALNRWFQLLSSVVTRQRLNNSYASPSFVGHLKEKPSGEKSGEVGNSKEEVILPALIVSENNHEHEHVFPVEDQTFDEGTSVRTKRCSCGFSIQVEEL
ncbi:DNA repair protein Rad4 family isoform X1 [Carex rostrata]